MSADADQVGGKHYKKLAIQPWTYILANKIGYMEGSIIKYVSRWQDKGGLQDLQKARHFLDKLIESETPKVTVFDPQTSPFANPTCPRVTG